ncbi:MAG: hypothetical protein AAGF77_08645 [Bacteroidota bacterium]
MMHYQKIILLVFLSVVVISNTYGQIQPTLPPSPTASALGKYVDNPVSLYTGTPNISIPLYEVTLKNFTLPISLNYNPQDVQVATVPSNVGLGWSLNAGGVITRVVRDWHDDGRLDYDGNGNEIFDNTMPWYLKDGFENPYTKWGYYHAKYLGEPIPHWNSTEITNYLGTNTYNLDLPSIYNNRNNVKPGDAILGNFGIQLPSTLTGTSGVFNIAGFLQMSAGNFRKMVVDTEPDIFYFNFAGYSGKFVFDVEGSAPKIRTIPYQNLSISEEIEASTGKIKGFIVKDDKGNTYHFEDIEVSEVWGGVSYNRKTTYNSSWCLSKITTAIGDDIHFTYENDKVYDIKSPALVPKLPERRHAELNNDASGLITGIDDNVVMHSIYLKRLRKIIAPNVYIEFDALHNRQDIESNSSSKAITDLTIYHSPKNDVFKKIQKYTFSYDYFESIEDSPGTSGISFLLGSTLYQDGGKKRLRFNAVLNNFRN